jgi:hypothetical protein
VSHVGEWQTSDRQETGYWGKYYIFDKSELFGGYLSRWYYLACSDLQLVLGQKSVTFLFTAPVAGTYGFHAYLPGDVGWNGNVPASLVDSAGNTGSFFFNGMVAHVFDEVYEMELAAGPVNLTLTNGGTNPTGKPTVIDSWMMKLKAETCDMNTFRLTSDLVPRCQRRDKCPIGTFKVGVALLCIHPFFTPMRCRAKGFAKLAWQEPLPIKRIPIFATHLHRVKLANMYPPMVPDPAVSGLLISFLCFV